MYLLNIDTCEHVSVHVCRCKCAYVHVFTYVEARDLSLPTLFLSLNLKLANFTRLTGQPVSGVLPTLPPLG